MNITKSILAIALFGPLANFADAKDKPFAPVQESVRGRTQLDVHWETDLRAREESRKRVRGLLHRPLALSTAVQVALLNNRGLQATFEEIGLSFADLREARTLANPELDLTVKFPDRSPRKPSYEWGIAQNFLDLLMIPLRTRVAREKLTAAQMRVADEVTKVVAETKSAYWELVADTQSIAQLRVMIDAQKASLDLMQKLHEAGNVTDLRLLRDQAEYSQLRLELALAEAELREHREKLHRLLGVWGADTDWTLAVTELPAVPASDIPLRGLETLAVQNRLDLAAARAELQSAARSLGLEKTFRFIGGLDFGVAGERESDGLNQVGPSLRFELPIFNQDQAKIARGEAQLRMAAAKFEQLAIDIRSTVRELHNRMVTKREIARFQREEIRPTRRRITALTLLEYNAMLVGAFEAFTARREDLEAERSLIDSTREYWVTRAELERAVGGDFEASRTSAGHAASVDHKTVRKPKSRKP
jgi:outer membrane protein, heavy metal efflux system